MSNDLISSRKDWEVATLGDVLKFKSGDFLNAASMDISGSYPVYGGNGINGYHSKFMFEESKIVIGRVGAYCGSIHYTEPYSWVTDNALYIAEKDSRLSDEYLVLALRFANLNQYSSQSGQPLISASKISDVKIVIPPLTEQKRIASLLARADRLRQLRRTAHELGESLLQSVFLDVFGEEEKQNYLSIQDLMDSEAIIDMQDGNHGGDYPRSAEFVSEGIPFLTATNVIGNRVFLDSAPRLKPERAHKLRIGWVKPNDVLLSHNATVGRVAVMPHFEGEVVLGTSLTYYRLNPEIFLPRYFAYVFQSRHFQAQLESFMGQTTRNQVPITRQRELFVPEPPPLSLQEEFAGVVARVESLRGRMGESTRQVEGLFESLLSEAFEQ